MFKNSPRVYRSDARTGLRMPLLLVGVQLERVTVLDSGREWTKKTRVRGTSRTLFRASSRG
ncbi:hypothetical protein ALQ08_104088 [Pseudomonas syringae pv. delphinii]|uniref:Uncharacterized protein n=1 Tax=Pseudomonas syringae pv. delphinii TaxID=192088 RepID=A0A0P9PA73_9PSED|nr:hypothetical protein ALO72_103355 [Pseudomonas syringae pv. delphinii]RMP17529.1 hypothetical protein ALQ28_103871 [Pseudomonas syringae pv. delphinii]RMP21220.1 hypothetical protein ALQ27_104159 [Pseudomonas syringae pv. delphinii]RMQ21790.1 hypothetical protein ALQ08_104088 [Pseudomonas syringae pv. delphinii]